MMTTFAGVMKKTDVDLQVRPQDDLYRFVNGTWLKNHKIRPDRSIEGGFYELRDKSKENVHNIVKSCVSEYENDTADKDAMRIAQVYTACMDEKAIQERKTRDIDPLVEEVLQADTKTQLLILMAKNAVRSIDSLIEFGVGADLNDPDKYIMRVQQSGLSLPECSYYFQEQYEQICQEFIKHVSKMLKLYSDSAKLDVQIDDFDKVAQDIFDFETKLASIHWDNVKLRQAELLNNPMTWQEFCDNSKNIQWQLWLDNTTESTVKAFENIVCMTPSYFSELSDLYLDFDVQVIKNWMLWKIITRYASSLTTEFVDTNFEFYGKILNGMEENYPRWERAVSKVESMIPDLLSKRYVEKHFPAENKKAMESLVEDLLQAYRESITDLDWMSQETKEKALLKLDNFRYKIGYPDKWENYDELSFTGLSLIEMITESDKYHYEDNICKAGKEVDRQEWLMTPQTVNAYYHPIMHEIVFPAAILQSPYFHIDADMGNNYGGIGAVIGHEIGHGFDDQGAKYDHTGALKDWWSAEDKQRFKERTQSLVDQYNQLIPAQLVEKPNADKDYHVNGEFTLGENIGDLGGLSIAIKAYKLALARQGKTIKDTDIIDGYNGLHRLFFSWARVWKTKARDEFAIQLLAVDPHSPTEFRCNQIVKNIPEFAEAFGVKPEDGMWLDPKSRVSIW